MYTSDSWDEDEDVRQLTGPHTKEGENESHAVMLDELTRAFDDDEVPGEKIEIKLAEIAQKRWGKKLKTEKLKGILEKYPRPENCNMKCTKVNPEIWTKLSKWKRGNDLQLSQMQQTILKATFATLQTTNALIKESSKCDCSPLISQSIDAIAMMGHVSAQLSHFRREQIKPAVKAEYAAICDVEENPDSQFLFGDDLPKNMKNAKEASQIGYAMKTFTKPSYKPAYKSKKSWLDNQVEHPPFKNGQKPFLWKGKNKHPPRKKTSWQTPQRK